MVDARRECGIGGSGPTSVVAQTGELARLVAWGTQGYQKIQNRHINKWRWLRSEFSLATVASDDEYAYTDATDSIASATISRFASWHTDNLRIYLTSAGVGTQGWLGFIEWDDFQQIYKIGTQNPSYPAHFSIDPRNNLRFGPKPDAVYTVIGDYQKSSQVLALDADTPEMPVRFHPLIVYETMKRYAAYHGAPEVWTQAREEYALMMRDLEVDQLPLPGFGPPLC